jgi:hypothetical protein
MGSSMMRPIAALVLLAALGGCRSIGPCGWDEALELGASYDVDLIEAYTPASVTVSYTPALDLTRPAPTCGALDGVAAGDTFTILLNDGPDASQDCSFWFAEITSPSLELGMRNPIIGNNQSHNQIVTSGQRDFGGGCVGGWELSVHAPEDDPFRDQLAGARPVVVAYRIFGAAAEANAACSALVGREPTEGPFTCGDAFAASMTRL